jgi:hypothetical protein
MVIRKPKFHFLIQVAGKTSGRFFPGINDIFALSIAAGVDMQASRAVTHLTSFNHLIPNRNTDPFMSRKFKFFPLLFMTAGTSLGTNIFGPFNLVGMKFFDCLIPSVYPGWGTGSYCYFSHS